MFYLKHKSLESETKVFYTGDNFFTECAECGDEVNIDLGEFAQHRDCDFLATSVYCAKCTAKKIKEEPHEEPME